jgi:DNA primase
MNSAIDVAKSVGIYQVIEEYAPGFVRPRSSSGNACCPFHQDKTPSFHVYERTNSFHCFSCETNGSGIDFVMKMTGLCDPLAAAEDICKTFNLAYTQEPVVAENKTYYDVYAYVESLFSLANTKYAFSDGRFPNDYWISRGLESVVEPYGLGFCPSIWLDKDRRVISFAELIGNKFPFTNLMSLGLVNKYGECVMADRYTIPIRDAKGRTIAFSGRARDIGNPVKYKNTPETELFKKREVLYNWDKAKGFPRVFLVEGQLDALSLIVDGVKNVASTMGSAITPYHLAMIGSAETVLAFDNDKAGREKTARFIKDNPETMTYSLKLGALGASKDFNDMLLCGGSLASMVKPKNIVYGAEFLLQYLASTVDLGHLADREFLYKTMKTLLAKAPYTEVAKDMFAALTCRRLGMKGQWRYL